MAKTRTYEKLTVDKFGAHLLQTGDLDPLYLGLHRLELGTNQMSRFLVAYWSFYNAGLASYLSERTGVEFWEAYCTAAENRRETPSPLGAGPINGNWPRGAERRHFRGMQAVKAATELVQKFKEPEDAVLSLLPAGSSLLVPWAERPRLMFADVSERVQTWRGFGSWISFKVGDMLDRCGVCPVLFSFDDAMYDTPHQAAVMLWKIWKGAPELSTIDNERAAVKEVAEQLCAMFAHVKAPPLNDRPVGFQEVETILCKWKSHMGGSYPLFNDIDEIRHGLAPWAAHSETAKKLLAFMPERK